MEPIWQLAISVIVAVLSAVVTVKLTFRRFLAERWWERKADAYASIFEALHVMKRGALDTLDSILGPERQWDKEYEKEEVKRYRAARDQLYKAVDTASFLLAPQAADLLRKLENDLAKAESDNRINMGAVDLLGMCEAEAKVLGACLNSLPRIARRDLKIPVEHPERARNATAHPKTQASTGADQGSAASD